MADKKVLILTYYWPPSGGSGVQRWLKFVRYLRETGWEPVVYTALNGEYPVMDEKLLAEVPEGVQVIRTPIWEPYKLYKRFTGGKKNERVVSGFLSENKKPSFTSRISMWVRGNLFVPDARKFWIRPSIKYLRHWLAENPVQAIVSTGPPHSMHLIGLGLHRSTGIPWLADFRDPWTNIDFYQDLRLSRWADGKHHRLEKKVVTTASRVVVVGNQMKVEFEQIGSRKVDVITNGYDEADIPADVSAPDETFSLVHIGMMGQTRNHEALWKVLGRLVSENPLFGERFRLRLAGKVDVGVKEMLTRYGLTDKTEFIDYVSHGEAIAMQSRAQLLLLAVNDTPNAKGVITGKIFEYLAARRPVFCIGPPDGDAAEVLRLAGAGLTSGFRHEAAMRSILLHYFELYLAGKNTVQATGVEQYSRKALTHTLAGILNEMVKP
jgi:hypothetical protein